MLVLLLLLPANSHVLLTDMQPTMRTVLTSGLSYRKDGTSTCNARYEHIQWALFRAGNGFLVFRRVCVHCLNNSPVLFLRRLFVIQFMSESAIIEYM